MSSTYTQTGVDAFTITHAKYLASKVYADLMRLHRYYDGIPSVEEIIKYHEELVLLQKFDFLSEIEYGFVKNSNWVKALKYQARRGSILVADDDPGGIQYSPLLKGASFTSVLSYNNRWSQSEAASDKRLFLNQTPIARILGAGYGGNWSQNRAYSAGGRGLVRWGI